MKLALVVLLVGCSDPEPEPVCTPGESRPCACSSGASGAQLCADDGSRLEACECTSMDAGAVDGGRDGGRDRDGGDVELDASREAAADAGDAGPGDGGPDGGPPTCEPGECDGTPASTCCVDGPTAACTDLRSDRFHCGACGVLCQGIEVCAFGACTSGESCSSGCAGGEFCCDGACCASRAACYAGEC